jgi:hypothetical protein
MLAVLEAQKKDDEEVLLRFTINSRRSGEAAA